MRTASVEVPACSLMDGIGGEGRGSIVTVGEGVAQPAIVIATLMASAEPLVRSDCVWLAVSFERSRTRSALGVALRQRSLIAGSVVRSRSSIGAPPRRERRASAKNDLQTTPGEEPSSFARRIQAERDRHTPATTSRKARGLVSHGYPNVAREMLSQRAFGPAPEFILGQSRTLVGSTFPRRTWLTMRARLPGVC